MYCRKETEVVSQVVTMYTIYVGVQNTPNASKLFTRIRLWRIGACSVPQFLVTVLL